MVNNDKKKQAKARRDAIGEKLKQISSSTIVHTKQDKLEQDAKLQTKDEIEAKFAPIAEDDAVSKKIEQKIAIVVAPASSVTKQQHGGPVGQDSADTINHQSQNNRNKKSNNDDDEDEDEDDEDDNENPSIKSLLANNSVSNRQRKQQERPPVSYLKSLLYHASATKLPGATSADANDNRDDLVDLADVTAPDPEFLMLIKDARNTIPVPIHWRQKSRFMSHTVDRDATSSFESTVMPNWVASMQIEQAWKPGMRAIEAFKLENLFKPFVAGHPNPELSTYGDLYFEGKDMRARLRGYRPGHMSLRLRNALELGSSPTMPPPWLSGMQKVARLPPSYPNLKIPGVNCPIPEGASYGRGRNQWGEPPRDPLNNNKFLFDGVDRSSASVKNSEEAQFLLASCWGTGSKSLHLNNNKNVNPNFNNNSTAADYQCIFTAPKEEIEAARLRKQQQELREKEAQRQREQENLLLRQQQQMQMQQQSLYNNNNIQQQQPSIVIPQHMLQAAGVTGYAGYHHQPMLQQQQQQQFGVEVNTSQNLPGMSLLNYTAYNHQ